MSAASGLPRLLRGIEDGSTLSLAEHLHVHGALETSGRDAGARLLDAIEDSGLRGHGGAHVSSALKLRAVAGPRPGARCARAPPGAPGAGRWAPQPAGRARPPAARTPCCSSTRRTW